MRNHRKAAFALLLFLVVQVAGIGLPAAQAQQEAALEEPVPLLPLAEETKQGFNTALSLVSENIQAIDSLEARINVTDGLKREVLSTRLDRLWMDTLKVGVDFADDIADKSEAGYDVSMYMDDVMGMLDNLPLRVRESVDRISSAVILPDPTLSAAEQAAVDEQFFAAVSAVDKTYRVLLDGVDVSRRFDIDSSDIGDYLSRSLSDSASNTSVFLDIAKADAAGLKAAVAVLPDDTELLAKQKIADQRVKRTAKIMERQVELMTTLDLPVARYKQQLLAVTGEISAGIFDIEVLFGLMKSWRDSLFDSIIESGPDYLLKLMLFFLIIYAFFKLAGLVQAGVERALKASGAQISVLLRSMLLSVSRNVVILLGVLIALSQIGLSLGPVLTGLGIAGFIVGFALQDTLSNFASGMLILFYRPFDVGDTVEVAAASGKVSHMSLVNTTILTFDNQSLIIPNNKVWQDVIKNVTAQKQRRIDMIFGVAYDSDIDAVIALLNDLIKAEKRVLEQPEPVVKVASFGDSSVDIICRPWVATSDYWEVLWDFNRAVKEAFDKEGIVIPFPQRDIHVFQETAAPIEAD